MMMTMMMKEVKSRYMYFTTCWLIDFSMSSSNTIHQVSHNKIVLQNILYAQCIHTYILSEGPCTRFLWLQVVCHSGNDTGIIFKLVSDWPIPCMQHCSTYLESYHNAQKFLVLSTMCSCPNLLSQSSKVCCSLLHSCLACNCSVVCSF